MSARKDKAEQPAATEAGIPHLDPELAATRDAEAARMAEQPAPAAPGLLEEPFIDPALIKARQAEIERGDKRIV